MTCAPDSGVRRLSCSAKNKGGKALSLPTPASSTLVSQRKRLVGRESKSGVGGVHEPLESTRCSSEQ